jgi:hypothetical protein
MLTFLRSDVIDTEPANGWFDKIILGSMLPKMDAEKTDPFESTSTGFSPTSPHDRSPYSASQLNSQPQMDHFDAASQLPRSSTIASDATVRPSGHKRNQSSIFSTE